MKELLKKYSTSWINLVKDVTWAHWNRLGLMGTGGTCLYSVDIEAALLLGVHVMRVDPRLFEGIFCWLKRYELLVNGERLATLIRRANDETLARLIGGLLEAGEFKSLMTPLKTCKKLCTSDWITQPLFLDRDTNSWQAQEPHWKQWGLSVEATAPREKLQDHAHIMQMNSGMRYRYLLGVSTRADVIYLLSISHNLKHKKEIDQITAVRLADVHIGCDPSTIYRIQNDLENGGLLMPQRHLKNQYIVTWSVKDESLLLASKKPESGLVRWLIINEILLKLLALARELETITDESIVKYKINEFQMENFPRLDAHNVEIPAPYGNGLGPLKDISLGKLAEMISQAFTDFYDILTKEKVS